MSTTEKKKQKPIRELHDFMYKFSQEELREKAQQLAKACKEKNDLEDQKKSVTSDFKAKIDSKTAEVNILSGHLTNGYEYLSKSCDVIMDFEAGIKNYYWEGILVGTAKLKSSDYQLQAEFEEKQEAE